MAILINKSGKKTQIDSIELDRIAEIGVLVEENTILKTIYILSLFKRENTNSKRLDDMELVVQIGYETTPPSKEQIMYELVSRGLSRFDIATVEQGYMLDFI